MFKVDPTRLEVFLEYGSTRIAVGYLLLRTDTNEDFYEFGYYPKYVRHKKAIPLGPEFPLRDQVFYSAPGKMFQLFLDRIPKREDPDYPNYCTVAGVSVDEDNLIILLGSIGARDTSSFIFESVYKSIFRPEDVLKFRKSVGISQHNLSMALGICKDTLQRMETGATLDRNTFKLLQIYITYPEIMFAQIKGNKHKIHTSELAKLCNYILQGAKNE